MAVVIGAQEDPGDPVQSLEASTTSSNASNVPIQLFGRDAVDAAILSLLDGS
jgi:hypothetical protein